MSENVHPVVQLLAKRMESHPEEFTNGRWGMWVSVLMEIATPEEKLLLRKTRMDEIHEEVMDELLNGEARRAEEERKREEETRRYIAQQQAILQQAQTASLQMPLTSTSVQGAINQLQNVGMTAYQDYTRNELVARDLISGAETRFPITDIHDKPMGLVETLKKGLGIK